MLIRPSARRAGRRCRPDEPSGGGNAGFAGRSQAVAGRTRRGCRRLMQHKRQWRPLLTQPLPEQRHRSRTRRLLHAGRASRGDDEVLVEEGRFHHYPLRMALGQHGLFDRTNVARHLYVVCGSRPAPRRKANASSMCGTPGLGSTCSDRRFRFLDCAQGGGKVEVDFQNSVLSTENKPTIMLRHAYLEAKDDDFRLLVGQTWDVISPLNPDMLLYSVGWDGGNIGYRRAQFRGERFLKFSDVSLVTVQVFDQPGRVSRRHHRRYGRAVELADRRRASRLDRRTARPRVSADHRRPLRTHRRRGVRQHDHRTRSTAAERGRATSTCACR